MKTIPKQSSLNHGVSTAHPGKALLPQSRHFVFRAPAPETTMPYFILPLFARSQHLVNSVTALAGTALCVMLGSAKATILTGLACQTNGVEASNAKTVARLTRKQIILVQ